MLRKLEMTCHGNELYLSSQFNQGPNSNFDWAELLALETTPSIKIFRKVAGASKFEE